MTKMGISDQTFSSPEMNLAAKIYLSIAMAENYPEQEPAYTVAHNWDLLWLLIPIAGFLFFVLSIEERYEKKGRR